MAHACSASVVQGIASWLDVLTFEVTISAGSTDGPVGR